MQNILIIICVCYQVFVITYHRSLNCALPWADLNASFWSKLWLEMESLFRVLAFTVENSDRKSSCLEQRSVAWV